MTGDDALAAFITRLQAFGEGGFAAAAVAARPFIQAEMQRTAAAGTDPYGAPWRPRKDGSRAIPDAALAVDAVARGEMILLRVRRGAAIQNYLSEKNRRQVIPDTSRPLPDGILAALQQGANVAFAKAMGLR